MFDVATIQSELGAPDRSIGVNAALPAVTVVCAGPAGQWIVTLHLASERSATALISVAQANETNAFTDEYGALVLGGSGSPRCDLEQVKEAIRQIEAGDVLTAAKVLSAGAGCQIAAVVDRFACGIFPKLSSRRNVDT